MEYDFDAVCDAFKEWVANENFIFLLLKDDHKPLGYAWIEIRNYPENAFRKALNSVYVHQLSIADGEKRRGYGSQLMEYIYGIAKSKGISLIELDYWVDNESAKSFYKKQGFSVYGQSFYKKL